MPTNESSHARLVIFSHAYLTGRCLKRKPICLHYRNLIIKSIIEASSQKGYIKSSMEDK